jgi:acetyl-CoA carboxylase carboxyltransferase component
VSVEAPLQGTIVVIDVVEGASVSKGQQLLVMESMKMEHVVVAQTSGHVRQLLVSVGDAVFAGHPLAFIEEGEVDAADDEQQQKIDLDHIRPDLAEVHERHAIGLDARRPDAVARRRKTGQRTARQNIEDLVDPGSFIEYGPVVVAAQRQRRSIQELVERTPADGLVAGIGTVNGELFDEAHARCIAMSYDYTVLAGTQGTMAHRKKDRMFELAETWRLPIVFFTEGGGGRPGDTDNIGVAGLDCLAFHYFGGLSGLVPLVGITSGRCFAGNTVLLGCCDVVIATRGSNIGMGGPAMIENGGLGIFRPEEVGPVEVQAPNGVIDILVDDEAEAVRIAKQYLSYFQGPLTEHSCADQRLLRTIVPENRLRTYDVREVIETLADTDSVLELRSHFGPGMVTALVRIEGRPLGIVANNPVHLGGAIDSDGADKAARFMQLCDAFDIPLLFLCDTPGIMVGPEIEKTALVRHAARMFVVGASVTVPLFTIVLRKCYGLGAQAMGGGSFKAPFWAVSWPTGEFGGMGLEGAVKLGYRNELAAIEDPVERKKFYDEMVQRMYEHGKAVNTASHFEIDDVIDPLNSRAWIMRGLRSMPPSVPRTGKKRPCIDTW